MKEEVLWEKLIGHKGVRAVFPPPVFRQWESKESQEENSGENVLVGFWAQARTHLGNRNQKQH